MAKKKEIEKKKHAGTGHVCGECSILILNKENRNYKGEPFFGYCRHGRAGFCRRVNLGVTYTDTPACEYFGNFKKKGGSYGLYTLPKLLRVPSAHGAIYPNDRCARKL